MNFIHEHRQLIIILYAQFNAFITGRFYKTESATMVFLLPFFGVLIVLGSFIYVFLQKAYLFFQIQFLWDFYFTKDYNNLSTDVLYHQNKKAHLHFQENTLKCRIYRKCIAMLNKRHNYTFVYKQPEF